MMMQKLIDMSKPTGLYLAIAALLLLSVFVEGRMGLTIVATGAFIPYQQPIAAGFFGFSVLFGLLGAQRHSARTLEPWRVPQSQVFLCFMAFLLFGAIAVVLSS